MTERSLDAGSGSESDYSQFYNAEDPQRWGRTELPSELAATREWLARAGVPASAVVLELGSGMGPLAGVHPGYIGMDFSLPALQRFGRAAPRFRGDMQCLPLRAGSVDFILSWAAMEHVPHPELVLAEISRVIRPGGVALLAPAWNVRPWAADALPVRPYSELSIPDRIRKAVIPVREALVWRAVAAMPRRLARELRLLGRTPLRFDYRRLSPNLDTYTYTDCDAFTSMDPHAAITYFASRGWEVLSHGTPLHRLLARHEPVVVRLPKR